MSNDIVFCFLFLFFCSFNSFVQNCQIPEERIVGAILGSLVGDAAAQVRDVFLFFFCFFFVFLFFVFCFCFLFFVFLLFFLLSPFSM